MKTVTLNEDQIAMIVSELQDANAADQEYIHESSHTNTSIISELDAIIRSRNEIIEALTTP